MSEVFNALQRALPQHALSRLGGRIAASRVPWLKDACIDMFCRVYDVATSEAETSDVQQFESFNDFFTRALRPGVRPVASDSHIVSPADGVVSQCGRITNGTLFQAKGHRYRLASLACDRALAEPFDAGTFVTIYLAPHDYHRVHAPLAGTVTDTIAEPGALFSVNATTETGIDGLFCRNERLVCRLETGLGPVLVVLVGAMLVASIEVVWGGPRSPYRRRERQQPAVELAHGGELGRFLLGSTVICCFPPGAVDLQPGVAAGTSVRVGAAIGRKLR